MRLCVIFNPTAKGDKARRFRSHLGEIGSHATLRLTRAPNDARRLAAEAVAEGFDTIAAAGGDGTINEVINGIAEAPAGLERARLGILPLGTVNVLARELRIPTRLREAWAVLQAGRDQRIDLPAADYALQGKPTRRVFAQLAGAGLDARAIEAVNWTLKKRIGPLAYVLAGLKALTSPGSKITVSAGRETRTGELILIGNGRLYGGDYRVFPGADLKDGLLEVCIFPKVNWFVLLRCGPSLLLRGALPKSAHTLLQAEEVTLSSESPTPFEVDGELAGPLPATFRARGGILRVVVP